MKKVFLSLFLLLFAVYNYAGNEARLLRFPAIHGDQIVFTYAGNLYTVSANGGIAMMSDLKCLQDFLPMGNTLHLPDSTTVTQKFI